MNKTKIYLLLTTVLTLNTVSNTEAFPNCRCIDFCVSYCDDDGQYYNCCTWEDGSCGWGGYCSLKEHEKLTKENSNIENVKVKDEQQVKFEARIEVPQINRR